MAKEIILDGDQIINATDWEAKSKSIIQKLEEDLFSKIDKYDTYDYTYDKEGNVTSKRKHNMRMGELMPQISQAQVTTKLNRLLRIYRPMNLDEARTMDDIEYLNAYGYYLDIISYINSYVTFLGDKQTFSAFCNITTETYNELLLDPKYSQIFLSFEDGFIHSNFAVAEAGLIDGKTTVAKLQTRNAGHNLIKNPEMISFNVTNKVCTTSNIDDMYSKYIGMAKKTKQISK